MNKDIKGFFNPIKWIRAIRYHKNRKTFHKARHDLELDLYHKILQNDMLHWGYFEDPDIDPESISIKAFSDAQLRYAENIAGLIDDKHHAVLDVGCGMGGMAEILLGRGYDVELLTPHNGQKKFLRKKFPELPFHPYKFENFQGEQGYGTVLNAESLQYIQLERAFKVSEKILIPGGKWIVSDYFRLHEKGISKSGHLLSQFEGMASKMGWEITYRRDFTPHVLPTISFAMLYAKRFLLPLVDFGFRKLDHKKGWLYYMTRHSQTKIIRKIHKEMSAIDPDLFVKEKKYMLYVLKKRQSDQGD